MVLFTMQLRICQELFHELRQSALTNVTVPYAFQIANKGYKASMLRQFALQKGINTMEGHVTYKAVADAQDLEYVSAETLLNQ